MKDTPQTILVRAVLLSAPRVLRQLVRLLPVLQHRQVRSAERPQALTLQATRTLLI